MIRPVWKLYIAREFGRADRVLEKFSPRLYFSGAGSGSSKTLDGASQYDLERRSLISARSKKKSSEESCLEGVFIGQRSETARMRTIYHDVKSQTGGFRVPKVANMSYVTLVTAKNKIFIIFENMCKTRVVMEIQRQCS